MHRNRDYMEETLKQNVELPKDIAFSRIIKAGKRIYYIDVKRSRNDELFLAITESKKVMTGEGEDSMPNFERHKIFIYREDFDKLKEGINDAINFIEERQGKAEQRSESDGGDLRAELES